MNNKIDNKNKFKFAKQTDSESLKIKEKRYQDLIADEENEKLFDSPSPSAIKIKDKQLTILLDPDIHYQMTQVITYKKRYEGSNITQAKFITDLLRKNLKRTFPVAKKAFDFNSKN